MATQKQREKRRAKRQRDLRKDQDIETLDTELGDSDSQDGPAVEEVEEIQKDYPMMVMPGPTSYEELDAAKAAREKAEQVREESWTVQDLVYNIAYHPEMSPEEKGKAITQVGRDFGKRLKAISSGEMEKEFDFDLLEAQAILAKESRTTNLIDTAMDLFQRAKLTAAAENKLSDEDFALVEEVDGKKVRKYPIHDKAHVRNALARAAQQIKAGGEGATDARKALPKIKAAAKKMGIGVEKSRSSILIEKDATGSWRAVLFTSNNFKDRDGEIIAKSAHEEYVEWINKNMDSAPVFATWHVPGTARTHPIDFVGFESGFLVESCPLTQDEAAALLKMQIEREIGLSIGGVALKRDVKEPHIILKYRQFEVSDLPLERAANPFTDIQVITKEDHMKPEKMKDYLTEMLGADRAEAVLSKMALTQKELQEAGVEEKEKKTPETPETPVAPAATPATTPKMEEILERVFKELGVEELSKEFAAMKETAEKVPVLEGLIKELVASQDEKLANMINPPIQKQLAWMKSRPSQSAANVLDTEKEEDKQLKKSAPELGWLSEATHTTPIEV